MLSEIQNRTVLTVMLCTGHRTIIAAENQLQTVTAASDRSEAAGTLRPGAFNVPGIDASSEDGIASNQVNSGSVDIGTSAPPPASEALSTVHQEGFENSSPNDDHGQNSDAVASELREIAIMAHAIDTATEEDVVTRIVQEVMARDAVEAVGVVVESQATKGVLAARRVGDHPSLGNLLERSVDASKPDLFLAI